LKADARSVVADTGPLHYLVLINAVELLPRLFDRVFVPITVHSELTRPETPAVVSNWARAPPGWLTVLPVPAVDGAALESLDGGERAVIALATSLHIDLILMDDRAGVAAARARGIAATGTLGLLIRASQRGLIDLAAAFAALGTTSFYAHPALLEALLARYRASSGGP
jgi:predicted nucleic acid-binding protein